MLKAGLYVSWATPELLVSLLPGLNQSITWTPKRIDEDQECPFGVKSGHRQPPRFG